VVARLNRLRKPVFETVFVVAVAISLALGVQAYAVKPYQIPSESMEPTLEPGQRVLVNRLSEHLGWDPDPGDIIVFHPPVNAVDPGEECTDSMRAPGQACAVHGAAPADDTFIKRVVAGPGDRLSIVDGIPVVNGERFTGDWEIVPCSEGDHDCDFPAEITVPAGEYFMLGDNRPGSDDSRFWGPVPRDWIIGEAIATYWPPNRLGGL
jgi:signal peptidase I